MNKSNLRENFKVYLQECGYKSVSTKATDAFFLERHGESVGIDFKTVLLGGVIPSNYKQKLENYFIKRKRKNPRTDASSYNNALKLLLEFYKQHKGS